MSIRPIEFYKPIEDFDGYYIGDAGNVYCDLGRGCRNKTKRLDIPYKINPRPLKNGYLRVYMRQKSTNKRVDRYIHRLVGEYFLDKPEGCNIINHINTIRTNNDYTNLEWTTSKGNNEYTMSIGHVSRDELTGRYVSNIK